MGGTYDDKSLGFSAPGEHASWGATNTGSAWLCQHLWERIHLPKCEYLVQFIVVAGASDFFLSSMIREPKNNWLVTSPSSSPRTFYLPGSRKRLCMYGTYNGCAISKRII